MKTAERTNDWLLAGQIDTHNKKPIQSRNDLTRLLYCAMLLELPLETVKSFWEDNPPLVNGEKPAGSKYFELLFNEKSLFPADYMFYVVNKLESFFNSNNIDLNNFLQIVFTTLNHNALVSPRRVLNIIAPFAHEFHKLIDIRTLQLNYMLPFTFNSIYPYLQMKILVSRKISPTTNRVVLQITGNGAFKLPSYNAQIFTANYIKLMPLRFGLPSYEKVTVIGDNRPFKDLCKAYNIICKPKQISIQDFCKQKDIPFYQTGFEPQIVSVLSLIDEKLDTHTSSLHLDCAYDMPGVLIEIIYERKSSKLASNILDSFLYDALASSNETWIKIEKRHKELLSLFSEKSIIIFDKDKNQLILNGKTVAHYSSAKILSYLISNYLQKNRSEFELREIAKFMTDDSGQKLSNVHLKFDRLIQLVQNKIPCIKIDKIGRGSFSFSVVDSKITFEEI